MNEDQLKRLEHLASRATPGPWFPCGADVCTHDINVEPCDCVCFEVARVETWTKQNTEFIAAAREAVPALIARVRQLEKDLDGMAHEQTALENKNAELEQVADWLAVNSLVPFYGWNIPAGEVQRLRDEALKAVNQEGL